MKWIFRITFVSVFLTSFAWGAQSQLQCFLTETNGARTGAEYGIRGSPSKGLCEGLQTRNGNGDWKQIQNKDCDRISTFLAKNQNALRLVAESQKRPNHRYPKLKTPKARLGTLRCDSNQWNVTLDTAETCDVTMTHCKAPKLDAASRLALEIRTVLTRNFGRMK